MTRKELEAEILADLGPHLGMFPVDEFMGEFIDLYGCVSISDVPQDEYHDLMDKHDAF